MACITILCIPILRDELPALVPAAARPQQLRRSCAGLNFEQASALAALFGGQHSLLARPRRACIADLIAFLHNRSASSLLWPQMCTVGSPHLHRLPGRELNLDAHSLLYLVLGMLQMSMDRRKCCCGSCTDQEPRQRLDVFRMQSRSLLQLPLKTCTCRRTEIRIERTAHCIIC